MGSVTIPLPSNPLSAVDGYKTYIVLFLGAVVIALNHFGLLPPGTVPNNPADWMNDEFKLLLGATYRSALNK